MYLYQLAVTTMTTKEQFQTSMSHDSAYPTGWRGTNTLQVTMTSAPYPQNVQSSLWCQSLKFKLNSYIKKHIYIVFWDVTPHRALCWNLLPLISSNITNPEDRGSRFCQTRYLYTKLHGITSILFDHSWGTQISNDQFVNSSTVSVSSDCILCWTDTTNINLTYTSLQTSSCDCWGL